MASARSPHGDAPASRPLQRVLRLATRGLSRLYNTLGSTRDDVFFESPVAPGTIDSKAASIGSVISRHPPSFVEFDAQDDADGNLVVRAGDVLKPDNAVHRKYGGCSYVAEGFLGGGSFGAVIKCRSVVGDSGSHSPSLPRDVAVKIVRRHYAYFSQAVQEINLLTQLRKRREKLQRCDSNRLGSDRTRHRGTPSPPGYPSESSSAAEDAAAAECDPGWVFTGLAGSSVIVRLFDHFTYAGHLCLVFEHVPFTLLDIVTRNGFRGLPLQHIRGVLRQLMWALHFMHRAALVHADLKLENIMVGPASVLTYGQAAHPLHSSLPARTPSSGNQASHVPNVRLIDLGSSGLEGSFTVSYIASRFYRAPEAILGCAFDASIDIWSAGCVAAELYTGLPLFPGCNEHDTLSRIVQMCGMPPPWMLEAGSRAHQFFLRCAVPHSPIPGGTSSQGPQAIPCAGHNSSVDYTGEGPSGLYASSPASTPVTIPPLVGRFETAAVSSADPDHDTSPKRKLVRQPTPRRPSSQSFTDTELRAAVAAGAEVAWVQDQQPQVHSRPESVMLRSDSIAAYPTHDHLPAVTGSPSLRAVVVRRPSSRNLQRSDSRLSVDNSATGVSSPLGGTANVVTAEPLSLGSVSSNVLAPAGASPSCSSFGVPSGFLTVRMQRSLSGSFSSPLTAPVGVPRPRLPSAAALASPSSADDADIAGHAFHLDAAVAATGLIDVAQTTSASNVPSRLVTPVADLEHRMSVPFDLTGQLQQRTKGRFSANDRGSSSDGHERAPSQLPATIGPDSTYKLIHSPTKFVSSSEVSSFEHASPRRRDRRSLSDGVARSPVRNDRRDACGEVASAHQSSHFRAAVSSFVAPASQPLSKTNAVSEPSSFIGPDVATDALPLKDFAEALSFFRGTQWIRAAAVASNAAVAAGSCELHSWRDTFDPCSTSTELLGRVPRRLWSTDDLYAHIAVDSPPGMMGKDHPVYGSNSISPLEAAHASLETIAAAKRVLPSLVRQESGYIPFRLKTEIEFASSVSKSSEPLKGRQYYPAHSILQMILLVTSEFGLLRSIFPHRVSPPRLPRGCGELVGALGEPIVTPSSLTVALDSISLADKIVSGQFSDADVADVLLFADLLSRLMCVDPRHRLTAEQALLHPFLLGYCPTPGPPAPPAPMPPARGVSAGALSLSHIPSPSPSTLSVLLSPFNFLRATHNCGLTPSAIKCLSSCHASSTGRRLSTHAANVARFSAPLPMLSGRDIRAYFTCCSQGASPVVAAHAFGTAAGMLLALVPMLPLLRIPCGYPNTSALPDSPHSPYSGCGLSFVDGFAPLRKRAGSESLASFGRRSHREGAPGPSLSTQVIADLPLPAASLKAGSAPVLVGSRRSSAESGPAAAAPSTITASPACVHLAESLDSHFSQPGFLDDISTFISDGAGHSRRSSVQGEHTPSYNAGHAAHGEHTTPSAVAPEAAFTAPTPPESPRSTAAVGNRARAVSTVDGPSPLAEPLAVPARHSVSPDLQIAVVTDGEVPGFEYCRPAAAAPAPATFTRLSVSVTLAAVPPRTSACVSNHGHTFPPPQLPPPALASPSFRIRHKSTSQPQLLSRRSSAPLSGIAEHDYDRDDVASADALATLARPGTGSLEASAGAAARPREGWLRWSFGWGRTLREQPPLSTDHVAADSPPAAFPSSAAFDAPPTPCPAQPQANNRVRSRTVSDAPHWLRPPARAPATTASAVPSPSTLGAGLRGVSLAPSSSSDGHDDP